MERKNRAQIITPAQREPSFGERIEARARRIVEQRRSHPESPALSLIERQIALALDQLDSTRGLHSEFQSELKRTELYTYNALLRLEPRPFHYQDEHSPMRSKLKDKLDHILSERRRLSLNEQDRLHVLHDRLLSLLNRHTLLSF